MPGFVAGLWMYSQMANRDRLPISMLVNLIKKLRDSVAEENDKWPGSGTRDILRRLARGLTIAAGSLATTAPIAGAGIAVSVDRIVDAFTNNEESTDEAQLFEKIRNDIATLVQDSLENAGLKGGAAQKRVIFYIDDLDRLEPVRAIELLEVIKNLLDIPGCVFVLAIDFDVVARGLKMRKGYDLGEDEDKSFFDKIIQVPFRMPTHSYESWRLFQNGVRGIFEANMSNLKYSMFHGDRDGEKEKEARDLRVKKLLEHSVRGNPRAVKRLLNLVSLSVKLSKGTKGNKSLSTSEICQVIVLTALQMSCEPISRLIAKHQNDPSGLLMALCLANQFISLLEEETAEVAAAQDPDVSEDANDRFDRIKKQVFHAGCAKLNNERCGPFRYRFGRPLQDDAKVKGKLEQGLDDLWEFLKQRANDKVLRRRLEMDVPSLAELLFEAIDADGKRTSEGLLEKEELESFRIAVAAAQTTSVDRGVAAHDGPRKSGLRISGHDGRVILDRVFLAIPAA